jgi:hypothetical protein
MRSKIRTAQSIKSSTLIDFEEVPLPVPASSRRMLREYRSQLPVAQILDFAQTSALGLGRQGSEDRTMHADFISAEEKSFHCSDVDT